MYIYSSSLGINCEIKKKALCKYQMCKMYNHNILTNHYKYVWDIRLWIGKTLDNVDDNENKYKIIISFVQ